MRKSIVEKIKKRINSFSENYVFTISDFADIAGAKTISKTLDRMCECTGLKKLSRGLFCRETTEPEPEQVARAIARANNWTIVPCGETAKYFFGLVSAPKNWTFVTNGTYRDYTFKDFTISFHHTSGKMMSKISEKTALVVQVIKSYGTGKVPSKIRETLSRFTKAEKERIKRETKFVTEWIAGEINKCL